MGTAGSRRLSPTIKPMLVARTRYHARIKMVKARVLVSRTRFKHLRYGVSCGHHAVGTTIKGTEGYPVGSSV
jgi:hypothetical protein